MRVLAVIPALLALSGTVTAAPTTAKPSEAELKKAVLKAQAQGLNVTQNTVQIPASAILPPGVVDPIFNRTSPRDANNPLLAKRDFDEGGCFGWASWVSANGRQGYYNDFFYAQAVFQSYDRFGYNWIGPMQQFNWSWYSFRLTIRNQDTCSGGFWVWDDILDMMDYLLNWGCTDTRQGWGYVAYSPNLVAMMYYDGSPMPGFQPGCNHTGLKEKLLKAKSEVEEAAKRAAE